nr:MMPL family transporter [Actinoplanes teichomyceticus]
MLSSAALIMVAVFASFLINANPIVKMCGPGRPVAVDATVVRCLLAPAVMILIGQRQWRLPGPLHALLPKISIEADPAPPTTGRTASRDASRGRWPPRPAASHRRTSA